MIFPDSYYSVEKMGWGHKPQYLPTWGAPPCSTNHVYVQIFMTYSLGVAIDPLSV